MTSLLEVLFLEGTPCFQQGNKIWEGKEGKETNHKLSFSPNRGEKVCFFKLDGCPSLMEGFNIVESDKKVDFIGIYWSTTKNLILLVELKGKKKRSGLFQIKAVIEKLRKDFPASFNRLKGNIVGIVVHTDPLHRNEEEIRRVKIIFCRAPATDKIIRKQLKKLISHPAGGKSEV